MTQLPRLPFPEFLYYQEAALACGSKALPDQFHWQVSHTKGEKPACGSITHYALRITHYALRITHYALRITHHALRITHYALRITHYALRITHYALRITHYA
ncbi:MAG TPA: hypothetical protein VFS21_02335, partial [Roseiflexaceae bacterium]|nr:hypothetical protein [Roseiflexaceae bacterium]